MANRSIAEVLKTHEEFVKSIEAQLESAGKPRPVERDFFLQQKEKKLGAMKARLSQAEKDKAAMIARMDSEMTALSKRIERFEKEIEGDRKNLVARPGDDGRDGSVVPERPIRDIRGIGEVMAARLSENGITRPSEVATMDRARLATVLGTSEERAAEFIAEARRLR